MDELIPFLVFLVIVLIIMNWSAILGFISWVVAIGGVAVAVSSFTKKKEGLRKKQEEERAKIVKKINDFCKEGRYHEALFYEVEVDYVRCYNEQIIEHEEEIYDYVLKQIDLQDFEYALKALEVLSHINPSEDKYWQKINSLNFIKELVEATEPLIFESDKLNSDFINEVKDLSIEDYMKRVGGYSLEHSLWYYAMKKPFNIYLYQSCFDIAKSFATKDSMMPLDAVLSLLYIENCYGFEVSSQIHSVGAKGLKAEFTKTSSDQTLKYWDMVATLAKK